MHEQHGWSSFSKIIGLLAIALIAAVTASGTAQAWAVSPRDGPAMGEDVHTKISQQMLPEITINANRSDYAAGLGSLVFTLTRTGDASSALDVTVGITQEQTWLSSTSHDVTFGAGEATTTLAFQHSAFSSDVTQSGTLTATVAAVTGYETTDATVSVNVISQEGPAVTVAFEEPAYTVAEDAGSLEVVLLAQAATGVPHVDEFAVSVSTEPLGASSTMDYVSYNGSISFGPTDFAEVEGSLVATTTLTLTILDDDTIEEDEQLGLRLAWTPNHFPEIDVVNPNGDACDRICQVLYPVTILDDDGPQITIEASRSDYVAGLGSLVFTLGREGDTSSALDVTVNIDQDETWLSSTSHDLAFGAGEATTTLTFSHSDFSSAVTQSGTLTATVAPVSRHNTINATVSVNVISQEGPAVTVSFEASEHSVEEDVGSFGALLIARAAAGVPYVEKFSVSVKSSDITASSTADFADYSEELTFVPTDFSEVNGSLVGRIAVILTIIDDKIPEDDEQFGLELSKATSTPSQVSIRDPNGDPCQLICSELYPVIIIDDDGPQITIDASRSDYVAGLGPLVFTLNRTADASSALDVTVNITQDESWLSSTSHDLTFGAGEATTTLTFQHSDFSSAVTQSGTLTATVAAVTGYDTDDATVSVNVISQQGPAVTVSFEQSEYTVSEDAGEFRPVLVARAAAGVPYVDTFRVSVSASANEASSPDDYAPYSEILAFVTSEFTEVEGSLTATTSVVLTIVDDETHESDEQFGLSLGGSPGMSSEISLLEPNGDPCGTVCTNHYPVTIIDNDGPAVTVSYEEPTYSVAEGEAVTIKVVLSEDSERHVIVPITVTEQGGASISDYSVDDEVVEFSPGETSRTLYIEAPQDFWNDDGESLLLEFGELPTGVTGGTHTTTTVTIIDDDEGDPALNVGTPAAYWTVRPQSDELHPDVADLNANLFVLDSCRGSKSFKVFWNGPGDGRQADRWEALISEHGAVGDLHHQFRTDRSDPRFTSLYGTVWADGEINLSIRVRGWFGSDGLGEWSPAVSLVCLEEQE